VNYNIRSVEVLDLCIKIEVLCKSHTKCITKYKSILFRTEVCKRNK